MEAEKRCTRLYRTAMPLNSNLTIRGNFILCGIKAPLGRKKHLKGADADLKSSILFREILILPCELTDVFGGFGEDGCLNGVVSQDATQSYTWCCREKPLF